MVLCLVLALLLGLIVRVLCCYKGLWLVLVFSVRTMGMAYGYGLWVWYGLGVWLWIYLGLVLWLG